MSELRSYRLYRFDRSGHIVGFKVLDCSTDYDAMERARQLATSEEQELWSGERFLARVKSGRAA